jgi:hypothetical protein
VLEDNRPSGDRAAGGPGEEGGVIDRPQPQAPRERAEAHERHAEERQAVQPEHGESGAAQHRRRRDRRRRRGRERQTGRQRTGGQVIRPAPDRIRHRRES